MTRFVLSLLILSFLPGCGPPPSPVPALPSTSPLYAAVDRVSCAWEDRGDLPSIDTPECRRWLRGVQIYIIPEAEWPDMFNLCPLGMDGTCADLPECRNVRGCAAATWLPLGRGTRRTHVPHIYLTPGQTADGHEAAAAHEAVHFLAMCSGHPDGYGGESDPRLWGPDGVLWVSRRAGSSSAR